MDDQQLLRYSRHIMLDEIGIEGQRALLAARVLVIGAGGLGSPVALYLAASGVGSIVIADHDTVDLTNLQRQIAHRSDSIGQPKVASAQRAMQDVNPQVQVLALQERLQGERLQQEVAAADLVLDCSDNFATRHAVNAACVQAKVPLVSGAAVRVDGQISVFDPRNPASPCYACLFPPEQEFEDVQCSTLGIFAPLVGLVGAMQAAEALKLLVPFGQPLVGQLLLIEARSMRFSSMRVARNPACSVCGGQHA